MKYYRRENYLKRIRNFYDDGNIIKVITGIRRCGRSTLLKSIIEELQEKGIPEKDIISIELDKKEFKKIVTPEQLEDKITYISSVVQQIFEKDIKTNNKIKDVALFEVIEKFIINNFGSVISISSIYEYLVKKEKLKVDRRTLKRYIDILKKQK